MSRPNAHLTVRPYTPADRAAVHCIAADTAFFGEPVEAFLEDRLLFCEAFYAYYTDLEPEHCWVACVDQALVGFLVGCTDTVVQRKKWLSQILPGVVRHLCQGRYRLGRRTWRYTVSLIRASLRNEFTDVDLGIYPAHLHINVDVSWRGQGLGRRLMKVYLVQLQQLGVPGVHLNTTSLNQAACQLYLKLGFQLLDTRLTQIWTHLLGKPVENQSYGLRLNVIK